MAKFLADNTVFVAGIKAFPEHKTNSLKVLLHLIDRKDKKLIMDDVLKKEYQKYAERFGGERTQGLILTLLDKAEQIEPDNRFVKIVKPYFNEESDPEDIIHAATALQEDAIIITNDSDFQEISEKGVLEIWNHAKAMKKFEII